MEHFNPLLKRMGFSENDRVVIIHADDIGMCHSSIIAYKNLITTEIVTSGAVMVPCPWFLSAVDLSQEISAIDLGIHITLTSEWDSYRWRPLTTCDPVSGMIDQQGYFHKSVNTVQEKANPEYVKIEMGEQINRAIQSGLNATHIDTHMGAVAHPNFMMDYIKLSIVHGLPAMTFRFNEEGWQNIGLKPSEAKMATKLILDLEEQNFPLLDNLRSMPLDFPEERKERAKKIIKEIPIGLTHFIIHPCIDTPEIRAITPDWACRVADYELFRQEEMLEFIIGQGIKLIGYQNIKNTMPTSPVLFS